MKKVRHFVIILSIFAIYSCSDEDNIQLDNQFTEKNDGIPFTATINSNVSTTRALSEDGNRIIASWGVGDKVALIHNSVRDEMTVESVDASGVATISGTLTGSPTTGDEVYIMYPSSASNDDPYYYKLRKKDFFMGQNGTLTGTDGTSISEKYDLREGRGTLIVGDKASLDGNVTLENQIAIFKMTLKNLEGTNDITTSEVIINNGLDYICASVNLASPSNTFYLALPLTDLVQVFVKGSDGKNYFNMIDYDDGALEAKYYKSTVKLATVGDVILSTGKFAKAGTANAAGMIAYLGSSEEAGCKNGLAIALKDVSGSTTWSYQKVYASNYTPRILPVGNWQMPTLMQWQYMMLGCGSSITPSKSPSDGVDCSDLQSKLSAANGDKLTSRYWTRTQSDGYTWNVNFEWYSNTAYFARGGDSFSAHARSCASF